MALELTLEATTTVPIEVEGITPDAVRALGLSEIERLPVFHGNRKVPLAELFRARGDARDETIVFAGELLAGVHWIGAHMSCGRVRIEASAGRHVGSQMRGGEIEALGDVDDWLGGEMHGGVIRVRGNAGHQVGAAYRGSAKGMTRGTILIDGDAGDEIGHSMRRGLIAVAGRAGDFVGFNMRAGTILIGGEAGIRHGAAMLRGTIAFVSHRPPLLPSFRFACRYEPGFMALLERELARHGFAFREPLSQRPFDLYSGDLSEGGRGEVLLRGA